MIKSITFEVDRYEIVITETGYIKISFSFDKEHSTDCIFSGTLAHLEQRLKEIG